VYLRYWKRSVDKETGEKRFEPEERGKDYQGTEEKNQRKRKDTLLFKKT